MLRKRASGGDQTSAWDSAIVQAADASMALIRFHPDGTIIDANANFLATVGYDLHEIVGKHHRIFVDKDEAASPAYQRFWPDLAKGLIDSGEFRRIRKNGQQVWITASYTPITDKDGKVLQIVKFAQDITAQKTATLALIGALERLAAGDFSVRLPDSGPEAGRQLRHSFNATVEKLTQMVSGILTGTSVLDGVTSDVEGFSRRLSADTGKQEHDLAETRAAVRQISEQVKATMATVATLDTDASAAASKARAGAGIVRQAVDAVRSIQALARQVSQNTEVIESFAFQTNLLSLNAAVEAARAGEAGRGFAVVAAEVRNLANKSREASQIIADLTRRCEAEVVHGTKLIETAGVALEEMQDMAANVAQTTTGISARAREQVRGIEMMETSLLRINDSVQGVITLARSGDEKAQLLREQTARLRDLVESFVQRDDALPGVAAAASHRHIRQHRRAG